MNKRILIILMILMFSLFACSGDTEKSVPDIVERVEERVTESIAKSVGDNDGPAIGEAVSNFTLPDLDGRNISLESFRGSYVVLEWINYECPFVVKHYATGNMQALQNRYMEKGVVWLGIGSSAPGEQGYFSPEDWKRLAAERDTSPTHILLDPAGNVGRLYRARTTPEMFVINPEGILEYMGAIDDDPTADHGNVENAHNYVKAALDALLAGEKVETTVTRPYGCTVKYKN